MELEHFTKTKELETPGYKKVYFGDEFDKKSPEELQEMGLENLQEKEGKGWYNLKLISRDNTPRTT